MNIAGIICEYNPMHNGHVRHISATREILGDCGIVCVMSGNFVQRGDFAVMNKFARAKAAVLSGADLVIELPVPWCISSAERFAFGGVSILENIGAVTHISFGSESGDTGRLIKTAELLLNTNIDDIIRSELESGISYATARQKAAEKLAGSELPELRSPNDILAMEYLKVINKIGSKLSPIAVRRVGALHDGQAFSDTPSSSFLRDMMSLGEDIKNYVPKGVYSVATEEIYYGRCPVSAGVCDAAIMARLRSMSDDDYSRLPDSSEGLGMRLKSAAIAGTCVENVLEKTRTKRYAYSRLRRMILAAYLGVTADDIKCAPPYARVLAMNDVGRQIISLINERSRIPVIIKPSKAKELDENAKRIFDLGAKTSDLYSLAYPDVSQRIGNTEYTTSPYVYKEDH